MLQIAAWIFAVCFGVGLIALMCCRAGALADQRDERDREIRRIRQQLGYE